MELIEDFDIEKSVSDYREYLNNLKKFKESENYKKLKDIIQKNENADKISEEDMQFISSIKLPVFKTDSVLLNSSQFIWTILLELFINSNLGFNNEKQI